MRRTIVIAATVLGLAAAGLGTQAWEAQAQPAPADMAGPHGPGPGGPGAGPGMGGGWHPHGPMGGRFGMRERMRHMMGTFALFHPAEDRKLTGADVQKIGEGFLLWNGYHDWKVTGVTEQDDKTVGFNIATTSGDVIAHFTMDRHTGRISRVS